MTTAHIENDLRQALTRITHAWNRPDAPTEPTRGQRNASHPPLPAAWFTRQAAHDDLAYWAARAHDDALTTAPPPNPDTPTLTTHLQAHARALSGWAYAQRMTYELAIHAHALEHLTRPRQGVALGPCPRSRRHEDGTTGPCGAPLRADPENTPTLTCPGCGHTDTIHAWQNAIIGAMDHANAADLAAILRRIGLRTSPAGIRLYAHRGVIPKAAAYDPAGRALYDVEATLRAFTTRHAATFK